MKLTSLAIAASCLGLVSAAPESLESRKAKYIQGFDVSNHQDSVDWDAAYKSGARFVIIKASGGNDFVDKVFDSHYKGATDVGMIRGGYHFARPDQSSGTQQAKFFLKNGGGWSADGITLPGMLDIETNPSGSKCYGKSKKEMVAWIDEFVQTYHKKTCRWPLIYTSPSWWKECTGDSKEFAKTCPLVLARWNDSPGKPIGGWENISFWQYTDKYKYGGDGDKFLGDMEGLKKIAKG